MNRQVQERLQDYFDHAEPALDFIEQAVFDDPAFIEDWEPRARLLSDFLKSQQNLVWLYYAEADSGNMLGVNLDPKGRYVVSRITTENDLVPRGYEVQADDTIVEVSIAPESPGRYDARQRPWFQKAVRYSEDGETVWTSPYQFLESETFGITAARAVTSPSGDTIGVLAADIELGRIGTFLDSFPVAEGGGVFLLLEDGELVVPNAIRSVAELNEIHRAFRDSDINLSAVRSGETLELEFSDSGIDYIGLFQEIVLPGEIRYFGAVVVPENAYLRTVQRNALLAFITGLVILLLAILLAIRQARKVTRPLSLLGDELEQIGNLRFRDTGLEIRSDIREIALISTALGKMKISLRAFSRYVPRDLVRQLLAQNEEARPGGSLKEVTAVFTDLAGFTAYSESLAPDQAFAELSTFLEVVANAQERHHGITSSFTGDGTLALFNAPDTLEDHGTEACLAAMEILEELEALNQERRSRGCFPFEARIGINTAEVLLGNLGTRDRFAYTAIGDGVNLASRLEGLGKVYVTPIIVGGDCVAQVGTAIEWRKIDRIAVVGRDQATDLYQPLGRSGEVSAALLQARDAYENALNTYFAGDFESALSLMKEAEWPGGPDGPTQRMIERIQSFIDHPNTVPSPWDGIIHAQVK
ncbi:MAG: adenylate/guanylate cyclase domain-containing protein [Verrucomicrobiota bacterium]